MDFSEWFLRNTSNINKNYSSINNFFMSTSVPDPPDPKNFPEYRYGSVSKVGLDPDPANRIKLYGSGSNKNHWKKKSQLRRDILFVLDLNLHDYDTFFKDGFSI